MLISAKKIFIWQVMSYVIALILGFNLRREEQGCELVKHASKCDAQCPCSCLAWLAISLSRSFAAQSILQARDAFRHGGDRSNFPVWKMIKKNFVCRPYLLETSINLHSGIVHDLGSTCIWLYACNFQTSERFDFLYQVQHFEGILVQKACEKRGSNFVDKMT